MSIATSHVATYLCICTHIVIKLDLPGKSGSDTQLKGTANLITSARPFAMSSKQSHVPRVRASSRVHYSALQGAAWMPECGDYFRKNKKTQCSCSMSRSEEKVLLRMEMKTCVWQDEPEMLSAEARV